MEQDGGENQVLWVKNKYNKIFFTKISFSGAEMGIQSQVQFWISKEDAENVLAWVALGFGLG